MTVLKIGAHSTRKQREETEPHQLTKEKEKKKGGNEGRENLMEPDKTTGAGYVLGFAPAVSLDACDT